MGYSELVAGPGRTSVVLRPYALNSEGNACGVAEFIHMEPTEWRALSDDWEQAWQAEVERYTVFVS
jgi:hypothetical protein